MAQKYLPYPVTKDWCDRVSEELKRRPRGAQTRLAEYLKISTGALADVLACRQKTSDLVEPIHEFFGWEPPLPPTASLDAGELIHGYTRMNKAQRAMLDRAAELLNGKSGDDARKLLEQLLKTFRGEPQND